MKDEGDRPAPSSGAEPASGGGNGVGPARATTSSGEIDDLADVGPKQRMIAEYLIGFLDRALDVPTGVLRGMVWLEAKQWQAVSGVRASAIRTMDPDQRVAAVAGIAERVRSRLARWYPRERHDELDAAFEAMLEDYSRTYARDVEPG